MLRKQKQNDLPVGNGRKKKVAVNNTKALRMIQMVLVTGRTLFFGDAPRKGGSIS